MSQFCRWKVGKVQFFISKSTELVGKPAQMLVWWGPYTTTAPCFFFVVMMREIKGWQNYTHWAFKNIWRQVLPLLSNEFRTLYKLSLMIRLFLHLLLQADVCSLRWQTIKQFCHIRLLSLPRRPPPVTRAKRPWQLCETKTRVWERVMLRRQPPSCPVPPTGDARCRPPPYLHCFWSSTTLSPTRHGTPTSIWHPPPATVPLGSQRPLSFSICRRDNHARRACAEAKVQCETFFPQQSECQFLKHDSAADELKDDRSLWTACMFSFWPCEELEDEVARSCQKVSHKVPRSRAGWLLAPVENQMPGMYYFSSDSIDFYNTSAYKK